MDGRLVPAAYAPLEPFPGTLVENTAAVQFDHRLLATLTMLAVAATLVVGFASRPEAALRVVLAALGATATLQYLLGVATLLLVVPTEVAAMHQAIAVLLLTSAVVLLHTTRPRL